MRIAHIGINLVSRNHKKRYLNETIIFVSFNKFIGFLDGFHPFTSTEIRITMGIVRLMFLGCDTMIRWSRQDLGELELCPNNPYFPIFLGHRRRFLLSWHDVNLCVSFLCEIRTKIHRQFHIMPGKKEDDFKRFQPVVGLQKSIYRAPNSMSIIKHGTYRENLNPFEFDCVSSDKYQPSLSISDYMGNVTFPKDKKAHSSIRGVQTWLNNHKDEPFVRITVSSIDHVDDGSEVRSAPFWFCFYFRNIQSE